MRFNLANKSVTLLELLLAVALMSLVVLGFTSIDIFSRQNVVASDRRARIQNTVAFCMAHMSKYIGNAMGSKNNPPLTVPDTVNGESGIKIRVDTNNNGRLDASTLDKQIAYSYNSTTYQLKFYGNFTDASTTSEILSDKIVTDLSATNIGYNNATNYVTVKITGRWTPSDANVTPENPEVTMYTNVVMPGVSVN